MDRYSMLKTYHKEALKKLDIQRNITTIYDLQCWLIPFFEINNIKLFLNLETIQLPSKKEVVSLNELDKIKTNVQPYRIYFRYYYSNKAQEPIDKIELTDENVYLSKIDAIIYILGEYLSVVDREKKQQMLFIINKGLLGELYNENKRYFKLDKLRKDNKIDPKYKYKYTRIVDFVFYGNRFNMITYSFTDVEELSFKLFSELVDYKRFNLYMLTEKIVSNNISVFRKLILEDGLKFQYLEAEVPYYFCVSGMNIYYLNARDIGGLRILINLNK